LAEREIKLSAHGITIPDEFVGTPLDHGNRHGESVAVIMHETLKRDSRLAQIVYARNAFGPRLALIQHRQHQGEEDADDGDDTKQFHQCERTRPVTGLAGIHAKSIISIHHAMTFSAKKDKL
jgi:hypothetical protein